jgi:hypothetical protein
MPAISIFRPDVRLAIPGAPNIVIDRMALRMLNDFFTKTDVWTSELSAPMAYTAGTVTYDPTPLVPVGAVPSKILAMRWRPTGEEILFLTSQQLDESFAGWETETDAAPEYYTLEAPAVARLYPIASETVPSAIEMTVSLTVAQSAVSFPDWIYTKFSEELIAGVMARMYAMNQREWTNVRLAAAHNTEYQSAIQAATSAADASFGRPVREVAYGGI